MKELQSEKLLSSRTDIDELIARDGGPWIRIVYHLALRLFTHCQQPSNEALRSDLYILF